MNPKQISLLCGCGGAVNCPRCARRERLNREQFGGEREAVLRRDEYQCQACGEVAEELIVVHHRKPGQQTRRWMLTLCRRCHVRAHFLHRPTFALFLESRKEFFCNLDQVAFCLSCLLFEYQRHA